MDTGASYVQVPSNYWDHFIENLVVNTKNGVKFNNWYANKGYLFLDC